MFVKVTDRNTVFECNKAVELIIWEAKQSRGFYDMVAEEV